MIFQSVKVVIFKAFLFRDIALLTKVLSDYM